MSSANMISFSVKTGTLSKPKNQGNELIAITKGNLGNELIAITKENLCDEKLDHKHQEKNKLAMETSGRTVFLGEIANWVSLRS